MMMVVRSLKLLRRLQSSGKQRLKQVADDDENEDDEDGEDERENGRKDGRMTESWLRCCNETTT